jgi:hypothetical protein
VVSETSGIKALIRSYEHLSLMCLEVPSHTSYSLLVLNVMGVGDVMALVGGINLLLPWFDLGEAYNTRNQALGIAMGN